MNERFRIETLADRHDRSKFRCGSEPLDRYFREQVTQDVRRSVSACYVLLEPDTDNVVGYYTLAASGVPLDAMPPELIKRLPRYPLVPVARLGRLAVDAGFHGRQLGGALLWDAATRAARSEVAVFALVVDAKDDAALAFYRHHGFAAYGSLLRQLILPLARLKPPAG